MLLFLIRWWSCVFVLVNLGVVNAQYYQSVGDKILPFSEIVVVSFGHDNFSTIQYTIDFIPPNICWFQSWSSLIFYMEKVRISNDKSYIILKRIRKKKTWVKWGDHNSTAQSLHVSIHGR
ncbi:hypothetical protein AHAS_Ahas15G0275900 [Arachis hypogaea]